MQPFLRCCIGATLACVPLFAQSPVSPAAPQSVCLLPIKATGVTEDDASLIADAVRAKCAASGQLQVVDKAKTLAAFKEARPDAGGECMSAECVIPAGEKAQAAFAASASLGKIGTLFTFTLSLYNVKEKRRLLFRDYQYRGAIEDFYTDVPRRVADDIAGAVLPPSEAPRSVASAPRRAQETVTEPGPVVEGAPVREAETEKRPEEPANCGLVTAPAVGIMGRVAVGVLGTDQSRWGAMIYYVHPTTPHSQARIKLGMPLAGNDTVFTGSAKGIPDLYLSLEHEWGFRYFSAGIGLAIMQNKAAQETNVVAPFYDPNQGKWIYDNTTAHFKELYCFNWVFNIRAGKPNTGFRGRISWPIPFNQSTQDPTQNAFFEYSALGVFGNGFVKGGIGVSGMQRNRQSEEVTEVGGSDHYSMNESYIMAPAGKIAVLIAQHNVVCLGIDFMGILVPRASDIASWAPNFQLNYTFSFGKLLDPEVLDGTF